MVHLAFNDLDSAEGRAAILPVEAASWLPRQSGRTSWADC
jgi:hypothetical protein